MFVAESSSLVARRQYKWFYLSICLLLSSVFLASCSGLSLSGATTATATPTPSKRPLAKLHWCNKPFILFRDEHAPTTGTPTAKVTATATVSTTPGATATASGTSTPSGSPTPSTLTDWTQIAPLLGFTVYLPATLPNNSCLVSASGTVNDPIFGSNFIIGYLLPDKSPISFSEAPSRSNKIEFQCTSTKSSTPSKTSGSGTATPTAQASPTQVPVLLCTGVKANTNIVFSSRGNETTLKQTFDALQPNVAWVPAS
ncbi:MAG: hypothetical protein ACJ788_15200 [Ktedonobacteraceae bacterium]|jgi:hypothetical protein